MHSKETSSNVGRWTCAKCGRSIGLWEPARWFADDGECVETSPLDLTEAFAERLATVTHVSCELAPQPSAD